MTTRLTCSGWREILRASCKVLSVSSACAALSTAAKKMATAGGCSDVKPATKEIQEIADKVKSQLEEKENRKFTVFKAVSYMTQVVAGTNYFIKVDVGDGEYVHLRVFESLPHEHQPLALHGYQTNKTEDDELECF